MLSSRPNPIRRVSSIRNETARLTLFYIPSTRALCLAPGRCSINISERKLISTAVSNYQPPYSSPPAPTQKKPCIFISFVSHPFGICNIILNCHFAVSFHHHHHHHHHHRDCRAGRSGNPSCTSSVYCTTQWQPITNLI